jgi:WD40 repeat protein
MWCCKLLVACHVLGALIHAASGAIALEPQPDNSKTKIEGKIMLAKPLALRKSSGHSVLRDEHGRSPGDSFQFSPDGKYLAAIFMDVFPAVVHPKTAKKLLPGGIEPDTGDRLAESRGRILLWNLAAGKVERTLTHEHGLGKFAFTPKGDILLAGCGDGTIRFWRMPDGALLQTWENPVNKLQKLGNMPRRSQKPILGSSVTVSKSGKYVAACAYLPTVWDWESKKGKILDLEINQSGDSAIRAVFSPDEEKLLVASASAGVSLWSTGTGKLLAQTKKPEWQIHDLAHSPTANLFATAATIGSPAKQGWVQIFEAEKLSEISSVRAFEGGSDCVTFSPDGKYLIAGGRGTAVNDPGVVCIWEVATGKCVRAFWATEKDFGGMALSPDGKTLAVRGADPEIRLYDLEKLVGGKQP